MVCRLVRRSSMLSVWVVAVVVLLGWMITPWALRWWMGATFAEQGTQVAQLLLLAFGVNSLAQIPFTALQAAGHVRSVALLHMAELVPYCAVLFFAISWLGIAGAAWACLLRITIDYAVLSWMWHRHSSRLISSIAG